MGGEGGGVEEKPKCTTRNTYILQSGFGFALSLRNETFLVVHI